MNSHTLSTSHPYDSHPPSIPLSLSLSLSFPLSLSLSLSPALPICLVSWGALPFRAGTSISQAQHISLFRLAGNVSTSSLAPNPSILHGRQAQVKQIPFNRKEGHEALAFISD